MKRILITLAALMLVLCMSAAVFAETAGTASPEEAQPAETAGTASLADAQAAYAAARKAASAADYETELKAMVAAGTLTQEQADLLLTAAKDQTALRSGVCPSCGYQFQTGKASGKANRAHGGNGRALKGKGSTTETAAEETTALEQAQAAYAAARKARQMSDYEAELAAMVEAGTLTQEQADLLLNAAKEAEALANGTCPSCGYTFQTAAGGRNGRNPGMGMKRGTGRGGRR